MMTTKMMETLKNAGIANEWHKGDMHRLYIDLTKASELYFDNNESFQHGNLALNRYERNNGKLWVEIESGEIRTKSISDAEEVISQIMELVAFLMPEEKTEEEKETEETEEDTEEPRVWYAVMRDRDDNDWGTGSFDLEEAKAEVLQMDSPDAYIAVIDGQYDKDGNATTDPICVDEIMQEDF